MKLIHHDEMNFIVINVKDELKLEVYDTARCGSSSDNASSSSSSSRLHLDEDEGDDEARQRDNQEVNVIMMRMKLMLKVNPWGPDEVNFDVMEVRFIVTKMKMKTR